MARVFTDGAESGNLSFWTTNYFSAVNSGTKRTGVYSYYNGDGANTNKSLGPALSEFYLRIGYYGTAQSNNQVVQWRYGSTVLGKLAIQATTGYLLLYTGTSTLVATGTKSYVASTWAVFEIHVKIDDSSGILAVKFDGVSDASFSGDTKPDANTSVDNLLFYASGLGVYLDDLALNDTNGSLDNSWCGDGKIILLKPNANGDQSDLVGSDGNSVDNYLLVDDVPHDSDSTYVESDTPGDYDLYNLSASGLASNVTILRVAPEGFIRDSVAEGDQVRLMIKTNSTEYRSNPLSLYTSYNRVTISGFKKNPYTLANWSVSDLDALQVGVEVYSG